MVDIARCLYIGKVLLGYPEREVWQMTLGKLLALYREYKKDHGIESKKPTIDDVIPEGVI